MLDTPNYQGNAVVNYTEREVPYTRVIEHKHFEMFGADIEACPKTVISKEYSSEWTEGSEPYYPVNDEKNNSLNLKYKELADKETNVIFGGRLAEYKYYDMHHIVEKALKQAAIWDEVKDRLKKSALGLSGGQQQRLCIARTLAVEPEVILMDEPTSALDPISTSRIEDLAIELKNDYTIIMVTHNMQQATRISDNTAFFLLGEMIEYDKTEQLFSMPKNKKTEDYITGRFG